MKPQLYRSPIDLPVGRSGSMQVQHRLVSGTLPIVSLREAWLTGTKPVDAIVEGLRVHELVEDKRGVWMTDLPQELRQIAGVIQKMKPSGYCLVGGLGLGILASALRDNPNVGTVVVVERSHDVVRLCSPPGVQIVVSDIGDFLRTTPDEYDFYFLDTWQATNEGAWWSTVMPLRRIIANRWGRKPVWCWAEDIMLGQCFMAAKTQSGKNWYYKCLPKGASTRTITAFFRDVGLPSWEAKYGKSLDELLKKMEF